MSRIPQLRAELMRAAENRPHQARAEASQAPTGARSTAPRRPFTRGTLLIAVVLGTSTLAAVALAATKLIGTGAPVRSQMGFTTGAGYGVAIPSSEGLLGIAAPDPAGGPPWTMRVYDTSRGVGCVQVGRFVGGQIGVIGQDGAFHDDGLFHRLPAQASQAEGACALLDGAHRTFLSMSTYGLEASAEADACDPLTDGRPPPPGTERCRAGDERTLFYGLLGPDVQSIAYRLQGHVHRAPAVGPQGAYLIVERADRRAIASGGDSAPGVTPSGANPNQPLLEITYRDGQRCMLTKHGNRDGHGRPCEPVGYVADPLPVPTPRQLASPVRVQQLFDRPSGAPDGHRENQLVVSFTARVAVHNARSNYYIFTEEPNTPTCRPDGGEGGGGSALARNVRAGEQIRYVTDVGKSYPGALAAGCIGTYHGMVLYMVAPSGGPSLASGNGASLFFPQAQLDRRTSLLRPDRLGPDTILVGRFSYTVPPHGQG